MVVIPVTCATGEIRLLVAPRIAVWRFDKMKSHVMVDIYIYIYNIYYYYYIILYYIILYYVILYYIILH